MRETVAVNVCMVRRRPGGTITQKPCHANEGERWLTMAQPIIPRRAMRTDAREFLLQHSEGEEGRMESLIKWTAVSGAVVVGAYFAYMFAAAARQRVDEGLA